MDRSLVLAIMGSADVRNDVAARANVLKERWNYFSRERPAAARTWTSLDAAGRWYLLMRSCDLVMYGKELANRSFPDPSNSDYSGVVASLVWLFEEHEAELVKKLEDAEEAEERERIDQECARQVAKIIVSPPADLTPRVLDAAQIQTVRNACIEEIKQGPQEVYEVAATIDEFGRFCVLLAKPENHIKVRSGQFIERERPIRTEADMAGEVVRRLTGLSKYTAYASVFQGIDKWKGEIRTLELEEPRFGESCRSVAVDMSLSNGFCYCKLRRLIARETAERQTKWRGDLDEPPPVHG